MKNNNRIPDITLELYYRGLATFTERRQVEKALKTDSKTQKRYEDLKESHREVSELVRQELVRLDVPQTPAIPTSPLGFGGRFTLTLIKKVVVGVIAGTAVLIGAVIYLQNSGSNKGSVSTEETPQETQIPDETIDETIIEEIPNTEIATPPEPPDVREKGSPNESTVITDIPRTESDISATLEIQFEYWDDSWDREAITAEIYQQLLLDNDWLSGMDITVKHIPPDSQEQPSNISIPPDITLISENMFSNRDLSFVIIPSQITSIGKNAFQGNPLVSVTIGADVSIEDTAIPGNFAAFYNANGKTAGTYTRPDVNSEVWKKN